MAPAGPALPLRGASALWPAQAKLEDPLLGASTLGPVRGARRGAGRPHARWAGARHPTGQSGALPAVAALARSLQPCAGTRHTVHAMLDRPPCGVLGADGLSGLRLPDRARLALTPSLGALEAGSAMSVAPHASWCASSSSQRCVACTRPGSRCAVEWASAPATPTPSHPPMGSAALASVPPAVALPPPRWPLPLGGAGCWEASDWPLPTSTSSPSPRASQAAPATDSSRPSAVNNAHASRA